MTSPNLKNIGQTARRDRLKETLERSRELVELRRQTKAQRGPKIDLSLFKASRRSIKGESFDRDGGARAEGSNSSLAFELKAL